MNVAVPTSGGGGNTPQLALRDRVLAAAAAAPSMTRRQGRRIGLGLAGLSMAIALALFELCGGLAPSEARPLILTVRLADGWALFAAGLTWLVLGRGGSTLARPPMLLAAASLAAPFLLILWTGQFTGLYPPPPESGGWSCLLLIVGAAATPLVSFFTLRRGIEPQRPAMLGAAVGAMCGAWAGMLALLNCPMTDRWHVLLWHVGPLVLLVAFGMSLGRALRDSV